MSRFVDRVHFLHLTAEVGAAFPNIRTTLLDTRLLKNEFGQTFLGAAGAFDASNAWRHCGWIQRAFAVGATGTFFVSDEYGPVHLRVRPPGPSAATDRGPCEIPDRRIRMLIPAAELSWKNASGRQANRGMEGLAITPDGTHAVRDHAERAAAGQWARCPARLTGVGAEQPHSQSRSRQRRDAASTSTRSIRSTADRASARSWRSTITSSSSSSATTDRDLQTPPQAPMRKHIYRIDLDGATDVSGITTLPAGALPTGTVPGWQNALHRSARPGVQPRGRHRGKDRGARVGTR